MFRRLTGLTPVVFRRLLAEVTAAEDRDRTRRERRSGRQRKGGAGRPHALPLADLLLTLLIHYRTQVPHAFLGFLFGLDDSNVSRSNRRLEPRRGATGPRCARRLRGEAALHIDESPTKEG